MKYLIFVTLFFAIACSSAPTINVKVSRFSSIKEQGVEERKYFTWINRGNINPLEFENITSRFNKKLRNYGFYEVENPEDAIYFFSFNASIDTGKTEIYSSPIVGETGISSARTYGTIRGNSYSATTYTTPSYGVVGSTIDSATIYTRTLEFSIEKNNSDKGAVFFARATSKGSTDDLGRLIPYLLNGIFEKMNEKIGDYEYEISSEE